VGDLDGASVNILVLVGEAEAAGSKANDAQEDKENSNDGCRFHLLGEPFVRQICVAMTDALAACVVMGAMRRHVCEMYMERLDWDCGEVYAAATRERRMIQPMKIDSSSSTKTREVTEA